MTFLLEFRINSLGAYKIYSYKVNHNLADIISGSLSIIKSDICILNT